MTRQSTDIQHLIREYRSIQAPTRVTVDPARASHKGLRVGWSGVGKVGFAAAMGLAAVVLFVSNIHRNAVFYDNQVSPSISLLSAAGITLSMDTDSPDLSELEKIPGLMDISVPDSLNPAETDKQDRHTKIQKPYQSITIT